MYLPISDVISAVKQRDYHVTLRPPRDCRARLGPRESLAAGFACKAAIRTGDELSNEEMTALVDELFATQQPGSCPHGRPTFIEIKLSELDHRFGRTG